MHHLVIHRRFTIAYSRHNLRTPRLLFISQSSPNLRPIHQVEDLDQSEDIVLRRTTRCKSAIFVRKNIQVQQRLTPIWTNVECSGCTSVDSAVKGSRREAVCNNTTEFTSKNGHIIVISARKDLRRSHIQTNTNVGTRPFYQMQLHQVKTEKGQLIT